MSTLNIWKSKRKYFMLRLYKQFKYNMYRLKSEYFCKKFVRNRDKIIYIYSSIIEFKKVSYISFRSVVAFEWLFGARRGLGSLYLFLFFLVKVDLYLFVYLVKVDLYFIKTKEMTLKISREMVHFKLKQF